MGTGDAAPGTDREQDPYAVLGVARDASTEEIVRAFRTLARGYHPDLHPGDEQAAERFRRLAQAYQVLTDPVRRAAYDRAHPAAVHGRSRLIGPASAPDRPTEPRATPRTVPVTVHSPLREPEPPLRAGPVYHIPPGR